MKKHILSHLTSMLIGGMLFASVSFAATSPIGVEFLPLRFFVNGNEKFLPAGQTGFVYEGSTYVPLRFVSQILSYSVEWNPKNNSILINNKDISSESTTQYMSDIFAPYYTNLHSLKTNEVMKIGGKTYDKGYSIETWYSANQSMAFNLDGKYTRLSGLIGFDDESNKGDIIIEIYGDNQLIKTCEVKAGSLPQDLDINIIGVSKLSFQIKEPIGIYLPRVDLVNLIIE